MRTYKQYVNEAKKDILSGLDKMSQQYNARVFVGVEPLEDVGINWQVWDVKELYEHLINSTDHQHLINGEELGGLSLQEFINIVTKGDIVEVYLHTWERNVNGILSTNKDLLQQTALQKLNLDKLRTLH